MFKLSSTQTGSQSSKEWVISASEDRNELKVDAGKITLTIRDTVKSAYSVTPSTFEMTAGGERVVSLKRIGRDQEPSDVTADAPGSMVAGHPIVAGAAPAALQVPFDINTADAARKAWSEHCNTPVNLKDDSGTSFQLIPTARLFVTTRYAVDIETPYYFSENVVTVGEFRRFVEATGYQTQAERDQHQNTWLNPGYQQTDRHPLVCVTYRDAKAFCLWKSRLHGVVYRLPTEAEWEFAARAGTNTSYWWGNGFDRDRAHALPYGDKARTNDHAFPVGSYPSNPFGLHDLHGNVAEYCEDEWKIILDVDRVESNRSVLIQSPVDRRTIRGGSFLYHRDVNFRGGYGETRLARDLGVRLVREIGDVPVEQPQSLAYGLHFDGVNDHIQIPSLRYDGSTPITLESWVTPSNDARQQAIIADTSNAGIALEVVDGFPQIVARCSEHAVPDDEPVDDYMRVVSPVRLNQNQAVHLAGVFDGESLRLFVGGVLHAEQQVGSRYQASMLPLQIGGDPYPRWTGDRLDGVRLPFRGVIHNVRVSYNARYLQKFAPEFPLEPDEYAEAVYRFDSPSHQGFDRVFEITDLSGNGHHGTFQRNVDPDWKAHLNELSKAFSEGLSSGYEFDGVDDHMEIPRLVGNDTSPLTIECIVTPSDKSLANRQAIAGNCESGGTAVYLENGKLFTLVDVESGFKSEGAYPDLRIESGRTIHIAVVFDRQSIREYVNGVLIEHHPYFRLPKPAVHPYFVGARPLTNWNDSGGLGSIWHFAGRIHDIRFSSSARYSESFQSPVRLESDATTIALFQFDETVKLSGAKEVEVPDRSGHGNNGILRTNGRSRLLDVAREKSRRVDHPLKHSGWIDKAIESEVWSAMGRTGESGAFVLRSTIAEISRFDKEFRSHGFSMCCVDLCPDGDELYVAAAWNRTPSRTHFAFDLERKDFEEMAASSSVAGLQIAALGSYLTSDAEKPTPLHYGLWREDWLPECEPIWSLDDADENEANWDLHVKDNMPAFISYYRASDGKRRQSAVFAPRTAMVSYSRWHGTAGYTSRKLSGFLQSETWSIAQLAVNGDTMNFVAVSANPKFPTTAKQRIDHAKFASTIATRGERYLAEGFKPTYVSAGVTPDGVLLGSSVWSPAD